MGKSRDRANRSGSDPINIGAARLSLDSAASSDIKVTAQDGTTLKKVFAEELHVGTGNDRVILKRNSSDGKVQFQTTDGSTTENATVGTGVVANPGDLPLSGNSAGDTKFVTSNNNLMIYNGTGWYKIATVTNSSPTISSAGNAAYNFATDGTPVIVEITATDPEGFALQYKYQVTSGSLGSTATVTSSSTSGGTYSAINANTLTSNKYFKVTPSTNTAHAGNFSITFSASDGVNVANSSASSFTLAFETYGSAYFDGTDDYLTVASSSDFALGTGDFTIECWVYFTDTSLESSVNRRIFCLDDGGNAVDNLQIVVDNGGYSTNGSLFLYSNGFKGNLGTDIRNEWHHIAVVRNSGTLKFYLDGVQKDSNSNTQDYSPNSGSPTPVIGTRGDNKGDYSGYISNLRLVVGTAVYTTDFTPAGPLAVIANTKLLTAHKNNEIVDGSSDAHTITKNGDVTAHASNPFPIDTTGYGSLYFDGSGDHAIADGSNLVVGTNDFTIEYWVQPSNFSSVGTVFDMRKDHSTSIMNNISTSGEIRFYANSGYRITADPISANTWNHVALQRASGTTKMYLNGKEQSTTYSDTNNYTGDKIYFGSERDTTTEMTGYISNFRQVIGSNVYTTSSVTSASSASSSNGMLSTPASLPSWGTTWTLETWIYITNTAAYNTFFHGFGGYIALYSGQLSVYSMGGFSTDAGTFNRNQWHHIALVNNAGSFKAYIDGVQTHSGTASSAIHSSGSGTLNMMAQGNTSTWPTHGYMADTRLVIGTAVYTGAFTPPVDQLTKTGGTYPSTTNVNTSIPAAHTYLLTNQTSSGTTIADNSDQNYTLVTAGALTGSTTAPYSPYFTVPASPLTAVTNTKLLTAQRPKPNAITNGSTMFPGEGTQITTPASSDFTLGTGDFTVEGWFNWAHLPGSAGSGNYIMDFGGNGLVLQFNGASSLGFWGGGGMGYVQGSVSISTGTWYHIAWVRISGTGKMYIDGVEKASGTVDKDVTTNAMTMNGYHTGYSYGQQDVKYSDLRIVKGLGVYTGAFSRPTGPLTKTGGTYPNNTNRTDPTASQTVLLTHQDSSPATGVPQDNSDSNHTLTAVGFGHLAVKGAGYVQVASDQSTNSYTIATNGNTRNARNWPFNYSG